MAAPVGHGEPRPTELGQARGVEEKRDTVIGFFLLRAAVGPAQGTGRAQADGRELAPRSAPP